MSVMGTKSQMIMVRSSLLLVLFVPILTLMVLLLPAWTVVAASGLTFLVVCWLLGRKNILGIFGLLIVIGYFQGAIELFVHLPVPLGIIKYTFLLGGTLLWIARLALLGRLKVIYSLRVFILWCVLFYILFAVMLIQSLPSSDDWRRVISQWSVLNIPLALLIYMDLDGTAIVYRFIRVLVFAGIMAAGLGVIQFVLGPDRLQALGIEVYARPFSFVALGNSSTFRAFSVFGSHYEFASFMVIAFLCKLVLQLRSQRKPTAWDTFTFLTILLGLMVTFNVTLWLTLVLVVAVTFSGWSGKGWRVLRLKVVSQLVMIGLFLVCVGFVIVSPFRERVVGIFDINPSNPTAAGGSLWWRVRVLSNSVSIVQEYPMGIGLSAQSQVETLEQLRGQRGWFEITSDTLFIWLVLTGGIPLATSFIILLLLPALASYQMRHLINSADRALFWGIWSVWFVGVFLGGFSNSAILYGAPTNLLVWASVAVLYKMPIWNKKSITATAQISANTSG